MSPQPAKKYARMICKHMKELPDQFADDPQDVRKALGLSEQEFKLGLDLCIQRGVIALEGETEAKAPKADAKPANPFSIEFDEADEPEEMTA